MAAAAGSNVTLAARNGDNRVVQHNGINMGTLDEPVNCVFLLLLGASAQDFECLAQANQGAKRDQARQRLLFQASNQTHLWLFPSAISGQTFGACLVGVLGSISNKK